VARRTRFIAWTALIALAAFQAYSQRYAIGPDGMSYLDLSDGVTGAGWRRLVDLYWSPAYPALIGIGRRISGAGPRGEIPVIHAVNFVCFVAMLAAFEYFLSGIRRVSVRGSALSNRWGAAAGYALFGVFALTMTPLELTTPDLLSDAAILVALGALLRLNSAGDEGGSAVHAAALGLSLGVGALAKSFLVP